MIRYYRNLSAAGVGMFVALILLMSAIGSTQPIHPALRGFIEGCEGIPQPCWYGIVPGVTQLGEANTILHRLGFERRVTVNEYSPIPYIQESDGCSIGISAINHELGTRIQGIFVDLCADTSVGEVLTLLSDPIMIRNNCEGSPLVLSTLTHVWYESLDLNGRAFRIGLWIPEEVAPTLREDSIYWYGFKPYWWYEQLDEYYVCR
jgi:hypothetical protein